ncbi:MAG: PAS domain S-box protein [Methanoregula sp.]|nr:PAS domain S-box protein [Methanoregula sp.]
MTGRVLLKRDITWWQVIAVCILIVGVILTVWSAQQGDRSLRNELLLKASIAQSAISPSQVASLGGTAADISTPEYQALKAQLKKIRAADPEIRFAYLMGQRPDGTIIIYVDSEPPESEDYSPPGQVYTEAPPGLKTLFANGEKASEGPYTDRWGTWVSGFIPVTDPATGQVIAIFGMDVDAQDWNARIFRASLPTLIAALFIVLLILVSALFHHRSDAERLRLKISEEKFSEAFYSNPALTTISTFEDGRFLDVNTSFLATLGYSREEVIGKTVSDLGLYVDPAQRNVIISQIKETGKVSNVEVKINRKNRDVMDGSLSAFSIDVAGTPRLFTVTLDNTERKRAESELTQSRDRFRQLAEVFPETIFESDVKGNLTYANNHGLEEYGLSGEDLSNGINIFELVAPEDRTKVFNRVQEKYQGSPNEYLEYKALRKDGSTFWALALAVPNMVNGKQIGLRGFILNITERRKTEEALRQANKKLTMLNTITRHDILNQLTGLLTYLELSKETIKDPVILTYILKEEQAAETIQQQIEFARNYQDIGGQASKWQILSDAISSAVSQLKPPGVAITVAVDRMEVFADPLLEKVFYNLMENSLRHGEHVTRMDFSVKESESGLILTYCDNGVGISEEDKKKLFQKGFGKHTGFGLFLSREILAITGITITENGEPGNGARFEITVPKGAYRIADVK